MSAIYDASRSWLDQVGRARTTGKEARVKIKELNEDKVKLMEQIGPNEGIRFLCGLGDPGGVDCFIYPVDY